MSVVEPKTKVFKAFGNHMVGHSSSNVEELSIQQKKVAYMPNGIGDVFPQLDLLFIAECGLQSVKKENFENMKRLTMLSISQNNIKQLPVDVFYNLKSLEWVDIGENLLTSLPENLLDNAPDLQEIYAYRNKFEFLNGALFKNNLKLERIEFDQNRLKTIVNLDLFRFKKLRVICMRYNVCVSKRFPEDISLKDINETFRTNCTAPLRI